VSSLPARVRVSRLPQPIPPNVAVQLRRLLPGVLPGSVTLAAAALAGGRVVGVGAVTGAGYTAGIEAGWRGKGIEQALQDAVRQEGIEAEAVEETVVQKEAVQPETESR
jgi:hypothetical protein